MRVFRSAGRGPTPRRSRAAVGAAAAAAAVALMVGTAPAGAATTSTTIDRTPGVLENGSFEDGLNGWTVTSRVHDEGAAKTESGGYDGTGHRLTHWASSAYAVRTSQTVDGVSDGWWTASAWVKSGHGLRATQLKLTGCGIDGATALPDTTQDDGWVRLTASAYVVGGSCTVEIATSGRAGAWANVDDVALQQGRVTRSVRGGDLSGLAKNEDSGAVYADASGRQRDAVAVLASAGMNLGRLKVWVDPADGYNEVTHVVAMAKRIKAAGMDLLVDFHYSDRWTDPGAQGIPAAWQGHTPAQLADDVYEHTHSVLTALQDAGVVADYVQVGNEINPGMLWPYGQTWDVDPSDGVDGAQWDNLASFLSSGARAVKEISPQTRVILHLTNINDGIDGLTWWFDEVTSRGVAFDLIGLSYYGYWHGSLADLQGAVSTLSDRYDKDVMVVETAYPFTLADDTPSYENVITSTSQLVPAYPATPQGQAAAFRAVQDVVAAAPGGRGLGAVYWEPAWTAAEGNGWDPADLSSGNAWDNQAVFDFSGRLLPAGKQFAADPKAPASRRASHVKLRLTAKDQPSGQLRATVTVTPTGVKSTGTVVLSEAGREVARVSLEDADAGRATLSLADLSPGRHTIVAEYRGNLRLLASTSAPMNAVVR